jgi:flagellar hook-associated protein 1 FlgK
MIGMFSILDMAARSLQTQQAGIAVAGENISNMNNPGYARQVLRIDTAPDVSTLNGEEGTGADAGTIQNIRSSILDGQVVSENSVTGSLTAQQQGLQMAEAALGESLNSASASGAAATAASSQGLSEGIANLFAGFQALSAAPSNLSQRQNLISQASTLASQFNQVDQSLSGVTTSLNQSLQSNVSQANQDLASIAQLNQQIVAAQQTSPGSANVLQDTLQQTLESLSSLATIKTSTESDGAVDVSIGGVSMVTGATQNDSLALGSTGGGQPLVQAASNGASITLTGGSIEGTIQARDGGVAAIQSQVNQLASTLITQVNSAYSGGYDLNGNTGGTFFTGSSAADIAVNSTLPANPASFQAAGTAGNSGDSQVVLALAQMGSAPQTALGGQTFSQSYAANVAQLGSAISSVNTQVSNQQAVSSMIDQQRNSVSGVSLNDEMTNLTTFQQAFQASAQVVTTIDTMLTDLLAMKTS